MSESKPTKPRQILVKELRLGASLLVACPCAFWTSMWLGHVVNSWAHDTPIEFANYVTLAAVSMLLGIGSIALAIFGLIETVDGAHRARNRIAALKEKATGAA